VRSTYGYRFYGRWDQKNGRQGQVEKSGDWQSCGSRMDRYRWRIGNGHQGRSRSISDPSSEIQEYRTETPKPGNQTTWGNPYRFFGRPGQVGLRSSGQYQINSPDL